MKKPPLFTSVIINIELKAPGFSISRMTESHLGGVTRAEPVINKRIAQVAMRQVRTMLGVTDYRKVDEAMFERFYALKRAELKEQLERSLWKSSSRKHSRKPLGKKD